MAESQSAASRIAGEDATDTSENPLARLASPGSLARFALPSIVAMVLMGLYTLVDVMLVTRFVSTDAMAAVNIATPAINLVVGFATMLATGSNAIVSARMGAGDLAGARRDFATITLFALGSSLAVALLGATFAEPLARALGATDQLAPLCAVYLAIILAFTPASMLQTLFQNYVIAAGRPAMGTAMAVGCGMANIAFDYLFIAVLDWGIAGAAWGTVIGYTIAAATGAAFFLSRKQGLRFSRPGLGRACVVLLGKSCANGVSEMVGQAAAAVTTFLFNTAMVQLIGENGVAAITVIIYTQFMVSTVFIGFSMGCAPVIAFNFGACNRAALRRVFRSCLLCIGTASVTASLLSLAGAPAVACLFAPEGHEVNRLASEGLRLFSVSFLFAGTNLFASAAFTALSNGALSALISFLRTFGLVPAALLVLPGMLGVDGVWVAVPIAEALTFVVSAGLLWGMRKRYGYS